MEKMTSLLGLVVFVALAWAASTNRRDFPWRTVAAGMGLQLLLAVITLRTPFGTWVLSGVDAVFKSFLGYADEGTLMIFGPLADRGALAAGFGAKHGFVLAVSITGSIILVSAVSALLYHYGILQLVVRGVAWIMRRVMGVSGSESLATAANIFMGQTEAPLVVKPYLLGMTRSELLALMTGGMATIAGGVLAAYVSMGISAAHLLTASVMSAPAALMMAKILLPEKEKSPTADGTTAKIERETINGLEALCAGASDGMKLAINVLAMLIAFVAVVACANGLLSWGLGLVGYDEARPLQLVLGYLNAPFAWLMGVPWDDCTKVGYLLGERIVLNEFVSYLSLSQMQSTLEPRSVMISTFALCGFANFASIAIQIGGIGALVPERRADLAQLGLRSMLGGLLACYCTAAIASLVG
jgi:CNT family concentrative nucleoside transporter